MITLMLALVFQNPFQVTAEKTTDGVIISAPACPEGMKYGNVLISVGTLGWEPIPIALNQWYVEIDATEGEFSAVLCGAENCTPLRCQWVTTGEVVDNPVLHEMGELVALLLTICLFLAMLLWVGWYIINKKWKS